MLWFLGSGIFDPEPWEIRDIAELSAWVFSLVGVFGFAYSRVLLRPLVWRAWLPTVIIWDIWVVVIETAMVPNESSISLAAMVSVLMLVLILPEYLALYFYGYRSNEIWQKQTGI